MKDFKDIGAVISLHGLGFLQITLPNKTRMHVWHPDLPRRKCFKQSSIHNHRFSFECIVLKGVQKNRIWDMEIDPTGEYDIISHNGARTEKGNRLSFVAGHCNMIPQDIKEYHPGASYFMYQGVYHDTPNEGVVITLMTKFNEGVVHANSIIKRGYTFDQEFDRFQMSDNDMWDIVRLAFEA